MSGAIFINNEENCLKLAPKLFAVAFCILLSAGCGPRPLDRDDAPLLAERLRAHAASPNYRSTTLEELFGPHLSAVCVLRLNVIGESSLSLNDRSLNWHHVYEQIKGDAFNDNFTVIYLVDESGRVRERLQFFFNHTALVVHAGTGCFASSHPVEIRTIAPTDRIELMMRD